MLITPHQYIARLKRWVDQPRSALTRRYLKVILGATLLPLFVVCSVLIAFQYRDGRDVISRQLQSVIALQADTIGRWVNDLETELSLALHAEHTEIVKLLQQASDDKNKNGNNNDNDNDVRVLQGYLQQSFNHMVKVSHYDQLFLLSRSGLVVAGSQGLTVGAFRGNQRYFLDGLKGASTQIQTLSFSSVSESINTIISALPVTDAQGQVLGVLCARANTSQLTALMLKRPGLGQTGESILVGENHILLTPSLTPQFRAGETYINSELVNDSLQKKRLEGRVHTFIDYSNLKVLGIYRWLPTLRATLVVKQNVTEAYQSVYLAVYVALSVVLVAAILSTLMALSFARRIVRPVMTLAHTAKRIAAGEIGLHADVVRKDELGQLGAAFNRMSDRVQELLGAQSAQIMQLAQAHSAVSEKSHALETQTAFLNAIIDNIPVGLFVNDVRDNLRFTAWNIAAEESLKIPRNTVLGRTPHEIFTHEQATHFVADDLQVAREKKRLDITEEVFTTSDGSELTLHTIKVPILHPLDGETQFILGIFENITERIAAKNALETANRELLRSNTELAQFSYVGSHDLQEPLRSVSSCVQLLQQRYEGKLDARADEFISHAVNACKRMQMLIDDLLTYSRISNTPKDFTRIDSMAILEEALDSLTEAIKESDAKITHGVLPNVLGDQRQLVQLFQNLIANAIKFRGHQPATIDITAQRKGNVWEFAVADQGIGIEAQYYERIFQLFQRLHTREEYPGTGIGLTICKNIVERHGGRIWVESVAAPQPGHGTIFYFTLPAPRQSTRSAT